MSNDVCIRLRSGKHNGQLKLGISSCRLFQRNCEHSHNNTVLEPIIRLALVLQNGSIASRAIRHRYDVEVSFKFDKMHDPMYCDWSIRESKSSLTFSSYLFDMLGFMAAERILAILGLIAAVTKKTNYANLLINLGDEGNLTGLSFCSNKPNVLLIPDSSYLLENGYKKQSDYFDREALPWENRHEQMFWRGSTTGVRVAGQSILDLPRVKLCLLAQIQHHIYDFGITSFVQMPPYEIAILQSQLSLSTFVPWQRLSNYRFHLDIDGNTNSWAGLLLKLHAGGLVFKVTSPFGYKQWYYDQLIPFENYIPVKSDFSDLDYLYKYYSTNNNEAKRIADCGRALALSLSYNNEFDKIVEKVVSFSRKSY